MLQALFNAVDFGELTSFFSSQYLVLFLPAVILMYAVLPKRAKKYGLPAPTNQYLYDQVQAIEATY